MLPQRAWVCAAVLGAGFSIGCSPPCEGAASDPVRYTEGTVDPTKTHYQTSSWEGPFLHFPGGRRYQLEHGLGVRPTDVTTYLAFDERPLPGGNVAESAGNQAVIEVVDEEIVQVRNDTCAEFYLRVTASTPGGSSTATDAGSD